MSEPPKCGDFVHYSIFTYGSPERPSEGYGHTDYFYGEVLSIEVPHGTSRDRVARVRSTDGTIDHVWVTNMKKVSLLEVIAAAADYDPAHRELVRKGHLTLAMTLASA